MTPPGPGRARYARELLSRVGTKARGSMGPAGRSAVEMTRRAYELRSSAWHGEPVPLDRPPEQYVSAAEEAAMLQHA